MLRKKHQYGVEAESTTSHDSSPALIVRLPAALAPHPTCFPFPLEAETFRDPNSVAEIWNLRHPQIVNRGAPVITV